MFKFLTSRRAPVSRPCFWISRTCLQDEGSLSVQDYIAHSLRIIATEGHQKSNTRTVWKYPLVPVISTIANGLSKQRTVTLGISTQTMLSPSLKTSSGPLSTKTKGAEGSTRKACCQSLTKLSLAVATNVPLVNVDHLLLNLYSERQAIMMMNIN